MIKPINYNPKRRKRRRIPRQSSLADRLSSVLDEALIDEFSASYSGHPFEKTPDNKYHLNTNNLEIIVYLRGRNIVTELKSVPDSNAETTLIKLLEQDELFSHERSPIRKGRRTINKYASLFGRRFGHDNKITYIPRRDIKRAKKTDIIDTIINYMIKPLLFLLPGPSQHLEKMY